MAKLAARWEVSPGLSWQDAKEFYVVRTHKGNVLYAGTDRTTASDLRSWYYERFHQSTDLETVSIAHNSSDDLRGNEQGDRQPL